MGERNAKRELIKTALEILPDDPDLLDDYAGFERVMWHEDSHMKEHGLTRQQYEAVVRAAYRELLERD